MDGMCNKPVVNRGSSLDNLLGVSNSWVKDFSKKIFYSDLKLSEKDLNNLYLGAEMMVYCYKDMKRASEDAYAF